jgi:hypothetical protein
MNLTKSVLVAIIYSTGLLRPAISTAAPAPDPETFHADKDLSIANIMERIQIDQKNLSCVQQAENHPALKACALLIKQNNEVLESKVEKQIIEKPASAVDKKSPKGTKNRTSPH